MTSELTKLKSLWRHSLTDDDRKFWRQQFTSQRGNLETVRDLLRKNLNIDLKDDDDLARFIDWDLLESEFELHRRNLELQNWQNQIEQLGSAIDLKRFQELQLKQIGLLHSIAHNQTLGLKAIRTVTQLHAFELNREKFERSQESKIKAGIDALIKETEKHPTIHAIAEQLKAALDAEALLQNN